MRRWIGTIGTIVAVVVGAGAVVGLVAGRGDDARSTSSGGSTAATKLAGGGVSQPMVAADAAGRIRRESVPSVGSNSADVGPASLPNSGARVVKHATLELGVARKQLDRRFASARAVAESLGGFVERSERSRGMASITVRVPEAQFGVAISRLHELGSVTGQTETGDDVSGQFTDLDARIRNLTAQEGVLLDLMSQARTIADSITVQQQLSAVRQEIEQLTGQRNQLENQASFGTIGVAFHAVGVAASPAEGRGSLAQAWHDATGVALAIVSGTIVVLGALVPLGVLVGLGVVGWALVRRRRPKLEPARS